MTLGDFEFGFNGLAEAETLPDGALLVRTQPSFATFPAQQTSIHVLLLTFVTFPASASRITFPAARSSITFPACSSTVSVPVTATLATFYTEAVITVG